MKNDAKIDWFMLRTGCDSEEAKKWLKQAKWKIDNAIVLRKTYQNIVNRECKGNLMKSI